MKRTFFYVFVFMFALVGCTDKQVFKLQGTIAGLQSDTIVVYYQEPYYKLDTLVAIDGKFEYTPNIDTLTLFTLLFDREEIIPVFADKGALITLSGSKGNIQIEGTGDNALMNEVFIRLSELEGKPDSIKQYTKEFIESNPFSYTTLYLLERYFFEQENYDKEEIRTLIQGLSGSVEDTYHAIVMQAKLGDKNNQRNDMLYTVRSKDKEGKELGLGQLQKGYTLLYFWASWDKASCTYQDSLSNVHKKLKNESFNLYGFSLDVDKEAWLKALPADTLRWKQGCNFTSWNDELVKQQQITKLPSSILLGPDRRVRARDVVGDSLVTLVKEFVAQDKKREREQAAKAKSKKR